MNEQRAGLYSEDEEEEVCTVKMKRRPRVMRWSVSITTDDQTRHDVSVMLNIVSLVSELDQIPSSR